MNIIGMREEDINRIRYLPVHQLINEYALEKQMRNDWIECEYPWSVGDEINDQWVEYVEYTEHRGVMNDE